MDQQHIVDILKVLGTDSYNQLERSATVIKLRKHLEHLPKKDLLTLNAIMYAGRDMDPRRTFEQYIDRSGIFKKEDLVQAMVVRLDSLQEYLERGLVRPLS